MADYFDVLVFSLVGGVFSLVGGALLLSRQKTAMALAHYGTPFAAGALLAAAFFDLLPESIEHLAEGAAMRWALGGIILFFLLEHFLHWFHHSHQHEHVGERSVAPLIIIGDSIHNFLDGIAIGAAFLINVPTGIVTAVAVAAHEIPQEIGDFGLLLKSGYDRRKVLIINAISALMATAGALLTFWLGSQTDLPLGELLALTAGFFIYIAASDIIPTLHANKGRIANLGAVLLLAGVVSVGVVTELAHEKLEVSENKPAYPATYTLCTPEHEIRQLNYGSLAGLPIPEEMREQVSDCRKLPECEVPEGSIEGDAINAPCLEDFEFMHHTRE